MLGSFGPVEVKVPRARMAAADGGTTQWRSAALPRYARMTRQVEALIAGAYLSGANTRRVKRALAALFGGAVSKDVVSRVKRHQELVLPHSRCRDGVPVTSFRPLGGCAGAAARTRHGRTWLA